MTSVPLSPVLIDDRAGSRDLVRTAALSGIAELTRLDSADVAICGNGPSGTVLIGVELKSLRDLVSSAETGRLQATQIPAMLRTYDISWLLVFGMYRLGKGARVEIRSGREWRPLRIGSREVPYAYLEGLVWDLANVGVGTRYVSSFSEAATWVAALHRYWSKAWQKHKAMRVLDKSHGVSLMPAMDAGTLQRTKTAASLPALGYERALAAASYFRSVKAMMEATEAEWAQVPGIGKTVARAVTTAIKQE